MVSIHSYLKGGKADLNDALARMVRLIVQAIVVHRVEGDRQEDTFFKTELDKVDAALASHPGADDVLILTGSTIKVIEDHNRRVQTFVRARGVALQNMLRMTTDTIRVISKGSERSVRRLQDIEKQVERASVLEDITLLKLQLAACLAALREEREQRKTDTAETMNQLSTTIAEASDVALSNEESDALTGLPGEAQAIQYLKANAGKPGEPYVVVFALGRLQAINSRYGHAIGDKVLLFMGQHLAQQLSPGDALFRCRGPAFAAIVNRTGGASSTKLEMSHIAEARLESTIDVGGRSVFLPLSLAWIIFPAAGSSPDTLAVKIREFIQTRDSGPHPATHAGAV